MDMEEEQLSITQEESYEFCKEEFKNDVINFRNLPDEKNKRKLCLKMVNLKCANRNIQIKCKNIKDETSELKNSLDHKYLKLQNNLHQLNHLKQEINNCISSPFSYDELNLVPWSQFCKYYNKNLNESLLSNITMDNDDVKLQKEVMHERLKWEIEERMRLTNIIHALSTKKVALQNIFIEKSNILTSVYPALNNFLNSSIPLQQKFNLDVDKKQILRESLKKLPLSLTNIYKSFAILKTFHDDIDIKIVEDPDFANDAMDRILKIFGSAYDTWDRILYGDHGGIYFRKALDSFNIHYNNMFEVFQKILLDNMTTATQMMETKRSSDKKNSDATIWGEVNLSPYTVIVSIPLTDEKNIDNFKLHFKYRFLQNSNDIMIFTEIDDKIFKQNCLQLDIDEILATKIWNKVHRNFNIDFPGDILNEILLLFRPKYSRNMIELISSIMINFASSKAHSMHLDVPKLMLLSALFDSFIGVPLAKTSKNIEEKMEQIKDSKDVDQIFLLFKNRAESRIKLFTSLCKIRLLDVSRGKFKDFFEHFVQDAAAYDAKMPLNLKFQIFPSPVPATCLILNLKLTFQLTCQIDNTIVIAFRTYIPNTTESIYDYPKHTTNNIEIQDIYNRLDTKLILSTQRISNEKITPDYDYLQSEIDSLHKKFAHDEGYLQDYEQTDPLLNLFIHIIVNIYLLVHNYDTKIKS